MIDNVPPVDVREQASNFKPMQHFIGRDKAIAYIHEYGGMLVEDWRKGSFYVIRIPAKD